MWIKLNAKDVGSCFTPTLIPRECVIFVMWGVWRGPECGGIVRKYIEILVVCSVRIENHGHTL